MSHKGSPSVQQYYCPFSFSLSSYKNMTCVLYSTVGLSFWGGIDPNDGTIIDHTHPLYGESVKDKVLCIPTGRGSCTGSQVMLELILNGCGPRSIILRDPDAILCTGAVIAQEFFGDECPFIPTMCAIGKQDFENLKQYADGLDHKQETHEHTCKHEICLA